MDVDLFQKIETFIMRKIRSAFGSDISFQGNLEISNPLIFKPERSIVYENYHIGYVKNFNSSENIYIESGRDTKLLNFEIPHFGIWYIKYNLYLSLSLGFSCLKNSRIKITNKEQIIINDLNNISTGSFTNLNISNSIIHNNVENEYSLYIMCTFGRISNAGIFIVSEFCEMPMITIIRLA